MRDFTAGRDINVGRDLYIQEEANQLYKPLAQCTNEELYPERDHRKMLLRKENKRKLLTGVYLTLGAEVLVCAAGLWFYIHPSQLFPGLHTIIFSAGAILVPCGILRLVFEHPSPFEQTLKAELQEINILLRKRGAE